MGTAEAADAERWRLHSGMLAFGTFAVGTDAFVIAGVIPPIAHSLHVTVAAAGQLVTVFAIAYAILSPVLAAFTSNWSRRAVLVTALSVFALGNVATALVPSYALVLASRVVAAAGASMYTPNAGATAAALAGPDRRGRAISIVTIGLTSAFALGAPLGTAIGSELGWRATMWFVTMLALLAAPVIAFRLPSARLAQTAGPRHRLAPAADRRVAGALLVTVVAFTGIYIPQIYISAIFAPATGGSGHRLAILLLVFGVAATAGNLAAGRFADRHGPRRVVIAATLALAAVFALELTARGTFVTALPVVASCGWASFSVTAPQQQRMMSLAAPGAEVLLVSLNAALIYLGSSLAGALGAVGLRTVGPAGLPLLSAAFALAAAALTWRSGRPSRRPPARAPSSP